MARGSGGWFRRRLAHRSAPPPDNHTLTAAIVETSLDAIITMDHRGRVVEFNPAAQQIFGYRRDEAVGKLLAELIIPPLLREQHWAGLARYLAGGAGPLLGRRIEVIGMRANRSELPIELTVTALNRPSNPPLFIGVLRDLTDRKQAEHQLRRTQEMNSLVLDNTQDMISLVDPSGQILYASPSHQRVLGYSITELMEINIFDVVHPDDAALIASLMAESVASGESGFLSEVRIRHKDGHWVTMEGLGRIIVREGEPPIILASARDISERKRGEEALQRMAAIVESSDDGIYSVSLDGIVLTWNAGAQRLFGYTPEEIVGRSVSLLIPADHPGEFQDINDRVRAGERTVSLETERVRKNGSRVDVSLSVSPILGSSGRVVGSAAIAHDITDRKHAEQQIAFLAYHDKLTGLPNRARFDELLAMALARARRHGLAVSVLYLDLDNFKLVNDSLGHATGDELLRQVADRLVTAGRETDTVARLGGDEFMVLVADLQRHTGSKLSPAPDNAVLVTETVAARIHETLREPFNVGESEVYVTASIGMSVFPHDADDARTLLKNADAAMYQSKRRGPARSMLFAGLDVEPVSELSLITRLRRAIREQQWRLHYQPIVELRTGAVTGVEALLRWDDPERGLIPPQQFIPLAEEMGLIEPLGDWLMDELFEQSRVWADQGVSLDISFNLSPRQLWQRDLVEHLLGRMDAAGVDPRRLIVEITESAAMTDPDRTQQVLQSLVSRGVRFAIDDFGTGYSSLSRLKDLPVDVLKIDSSFVRDVPAHEGASTMVKTIIRLALSMAMSPLAEGIESEEQCRFLIEHGCRLGQGFYFSRAVAGEHVADLCRQGFERLVGIKG